MLAITNICLGAAFEFHRGAVEELLSSRYITVFSSHDVSARVD